MNQRDLVETANALDREVKKALNAGYPNADCVYTAEVIAILKRIRAGTFDEPVKLEFVHGPFWCFSETSLGECTRLESAWYRFCCVVEDLDSDPEYQKGLARMQEMKDRMFGQNDN